MQDWQGRKRKAVTEERLVRAVAVLAQIVEEHGPAHGALYESVQRELEEFRRRHPMDAAPVEPAAEENARRVA